MSHSKVKPSFFPFSFILYQQPMVNPLLSGFTQADQFSTAAVSTDHIQSGSTDWLNALDFWLISWWTEILFAGQQCYILTSFCLSHPTPDLQISAAGHFRYRHVPLLLSLPCQRVSCVSKSLSITDTLHTYSNKKWMSRTVSPGCGKAVTSNTRPYWL